MSLLVTASATVAACASIAVAISRRDSGYGQLVPELRPRTREGSSDEPDADDADLHVITAPIQVHVGIAAVG